MEQTQEWDIIDLPGEGLNTGLGGWQTLELWKTPVSSSEKLG